MEEQYCKSSVDVWARSHRPAPAARGNFVELQVSLDDVDFGAVLLDADLRVTFVNSAFRKLWRLSERDCASRPAFVDLMRHGQAALGPSVSAEAFEKHVHATVVRATSGDPSLVDLRLPDGEVLRFQCVALPSGGRMLSYTRVTDIVHRSDELEVLRNAVDTIDLGVVLISDELLVQFVNEKAKRLWGLTDELCRSRLTVVEFITHVRKAGLYGIPDEALEDYVVKRVTIIKLGDPMPLDIPVKDGRTIRAQCTPLIGGGRMLTYTDVTDLVQRARQQELLAITDVLTGLCNRRHLLRLAEAEWARFRRYEQDFSLLYFDIDNFKAINDRFGHDAGDQAIIRAAQVCNKAKRSTDLVGRMGGDEFVVLLPQSDGKATLAFAKRLHAAIRSEPLIIDGAPTNLTISIGIAQAETHLTDVAQLLKLADRRLYRAKEAGRNCTVWCDDADPHRACEDGGVG
ncbi:MAG: diguanylate cyclase [Hyphomicrobium sp.]|uniref:sensor domain-containing diguanylate cyclase n=1 Tax=Hyphomicrobium sp. TaxID=82 RepID=UPI0013219E3A|nr:sensor domain-containing diguanylate cyclase [Hyphomicrobium sp.]KAB2942316.1 MAG: diguanylate cyclase [Hyphomicrobium sp.]MBZ0209238.1 diguanylate cyclase [Hyphomicrobium sp.]